MKSRKSVYALSLLVVGIGLAVNGYSQSFLTNGLLAYYPFNGNANDASGNGHNGTVNGAVLTADRFGIPNQAYYFDGASAYITSPLNGAVFQGDFTASVWINAHDFAGVWPDILHEQTGSFTLGIIGQTSGTLIPALIGHVVAQASYAPANSGNMVYQFYSQQQTAPNTFCQLVVTRAGTNVTMYLGFANRRNRHR